MSQMNQGPGIGPGPQSAGRPGQMTAVMRAMSQTTGPKVLRIGLVSGGRIIEERVVKQRTSVTIGPSERSMFVIQGNVPPNFKLFELIGSDYYLNFLDGMSGRVALQTGITDLGALKGQAKRVGNAYQVKLTDDARGKIVIADTTFLFQFVAPPPVQARPQLPLAVKGGVGNQIDWNLTTIAAFSLLFHFGLVFSFYSSALFPWADPVYEQDDATSRIVDQLKNIAPPPEVKTAEPTPTAAPTDTAPEPPKQPTKQPTTASTGGPTTAPGTTDPTKATDIRNQIADAKIALLGALGGLGPSSSDVLNNSSGPSVSMNGLKDGSGGVDNKTNNGLNFGTNQGGLNGSKDLKDLKSQNTGPGGSQAGPTTGPVVKGSVSGSVGGQTAQVKNADATIRSGLFPRATACYNNGLKTDPTMQGKVIVTIVVGPSGEVVSANASPAGGNISGAVLGCISGGARNLRFPPGNAGNSTLSVPLNFIHQ